MTFKVLRLKDHLSQRTQGKREIRGEERAKRSFR